MEQIGKKLTIFQKKVYDATSKIPLGYVSTYGQIAEVIGRKKSVRAVGNALNCNPFPKIKVPCHRVIKSNGEVGGYAGGTSAKVKVLRQEGITIENNKIDLKKYLVDINKLR